MGSDSRRGKTERERAFTNKWAGGGWEGRYIVNPSDTAEMARELTRLEDLCRIAGKHINETGNVTVSEKGVLILCAPNTQIAEALTEKGFTVSKYKGRVRIAYQHILDAMTAARCFRDNGVHFNFEEE
jgi:hypothetical protein